MPAGRLRARAADPHAWLLGVIAAASLAHLPRLPAAVGAVLVLLLLWRAGALWAGWPLPRPGRPLLQGIKVALALALTTGVVAAAQGEPGRDAGVTLLSVLTALKLLELEGGRDFHLSCFLGIFLLVTHLLYSQSVLTGLLVLGGLVVLLASLAAFNAPTGAAGPEDGTGRPRPFALAGARLAGALPLMLIAFLLFPRLPGPLWGLPGEEQVGVTGLSAEMAPGQVSALARSEALAFRVAFSDPGFLEAAAASGRALYWRGPVMWDSDGERWRADRPQPGPPPAAGSAAGVAYTVTLEPSAQPWLPVLDRPLHLEAAGARLTADGQALAGGPVLTRRVYRATSLPSALTALPEAPSAAGGQAPTGTAAPPARALALADGAHPRSRALAQAWRAQDPAPLSLAGRALAYFREQDFHYTLQPPRITGDPVDGFLFGTRRGFCEHYAAAFVVLMRAAGVPARIVTGYQGGEPNTLGGFLSVRQRDAHAWAEIWLDGQGWLRVDPTAAVAPARIELGMDRALPAAATPLDGLFGQYAGPVALLRGLHRSLDTLSYQWDRWILGYGTERQRQLLSRLGLGSLSTRELALLLVGLLGLGTALTAGWLLRRAPAAADPASAAYARFCRRLAREGLSRRPQEGPVAFARRAVAAFPQWRGGIETVTRHYVNLRYGRAGPDELDRLHAAVRAFRARGRGRAGP